ncbi:unnamed protein product [Brassica rapa]|uniref:RRM domain-containing protein n=2 Tax=Brassica TaxID=3705 RepID=A0A8D9CUQ1_BRACM|nr:unnamed protein product [Brassica napus]CAG7861503.1 unnamed protein product [Brassica rapa]
MLTVQHSLKSSKASLTLSTSSWIHLCDHEKRQKIATSSSKTSMELVVNESDGDTGKSRGCGFVCYSSKAEMETALGSLDGLELEGWAFE